MSEKGVKKSFKDTLNLPRTDFNIRADAKNKEPEILDRWKKDNLYNKAVAENKGKEKFILHDGPPYANGHSHIGHALNRTLKDIILKFKRMSGYHVVSVPGWDCHGLPIELKVIKESYDNKNIENIDRVEFKKRCREYAQKWIDIQREEIKRLGVVTDWDNPYITMSPDYEASILKCLAEFVEKGYIERKEKTVPWCASCETVLAISEIEYKDKKDPSCYILFPLYVEGASFDETLRQAQGERLENKNINLLIWTTTPWTIPLNRAVVMHPNAKYVVLQGREDSEVFIVGKDLADKICEAVGIEKKVLLEVDSSDLKDFKVQHPYIENLKVPIILDDMVALDEGTSFVHSAPGCGPEDYLLAIKNDLEIFSPLSPDGKYTKGIQPEELEGMSIKDGQIWSIKKLHEVGRLFHKKSITHSYPHCWRCKEPLMFRATKQWFCDLRKDNLIERSVEAARKLKFIPDWGMNRLTSSMESRAEWCLSRQRQWGVPITALICKLCEQHFIEADFVKKIAEKVREMGIEYWDEVSIQDLIDQNILPKNFSCSCGNKDLSNFKKEMDILDVWFESGVSHTATLSKNPELEIPANVYIEGSDQHRGWFQSSLLSSMIMYNKTCTKSFVTHAHVLDAQAEKMSKSKGNVVSPIDIIEKYSTDILRLWIAGSDFEGNIILSDEVVKQVAETYRKIRNTCRFMISNLYDFDIDKDAINIKDMTSIDQYALARLHEFSESTKNSYEECWFTNVFHKINKYCTNDLSSFYLDIIKDRLYVEKSDGHLRRSSQTVMWHILDTLTKLVAPILTFLAEEVSDSYQKNKKDSINLQKFSKTIDVWEILKKESEPEFKKSMPLHVKPGDIEPVIFEVMMKNRWTLIEIFRDEILKAIEEKRASSLIKHSLEAKVKIYLDESLDEAKALKDFIEYLNGKEDSNRFFKDLLIVSQFEIDKTKNNLKATKLKWLYVDVEHADGVKCPRCWQWDVTDNPDELCKRCEKVLS